MQYLLLFEESFLKDFGQSAEELSQKLGIHSTHILHQEKRIFKKLEEISPKILEAYDKKKRVPLNKNQLKMRQEINRTQKFVDDNGGKYFLAKYFLPLLGEQEKEYFNFFLRIDNIESVSSISIIYTGMRFFSREPEAARKRFFY